MITVNGKRGVIMRGYAIDKSYSWMYYFNVYNKK